MKLTALAASLVITIAIILSLTDTASATPAFQFNSEILSRVFFEEIRVNTNRGHHGKGHNKGGKHGKDHDDDDDDVHQVKIKAPDPSDVYVVRNTVPPGGHSGWHTHPGPSVVSVISGTATVYSGDDPSCTPVQYPAGTGFIDEGGDHLHLVKNEGTVDLVVVAFQIVPAAAVRRIDAPDPGFCPF